MYSIAIYSIAYLPWWWWESGSWGKVRGWPPQGGPVIVSFFSTWDAAIYLHIAMNGYVAGSGDGAFYPLWPGLIRLGSLFTGGDLFWSGLILANVFSLLGLVQFYRLVEEQHGTSAARWALALLLVFPGAIFLHLIYTEPLFLWLSVSCLRHLLRQQYLPAGLYAYFMPLTRAVGVFVLLVFFLQLWRSRRAWREYACLLLPLGGYLSYFGVMWYFTGNAFEGFTAQKHYPNQPSIDNLLNLGQAIRGLLNIGEFHGGLNSAVDRLHYMLFAQALVLVWRLDERYFAYALLVGGVPGLTHIYWSYPRLMMMAFPMFIALAVYLREGRGRWVLWYLVALMGTLQLYFTALYVHNRWAS
ncbi:mannosyltransferase family protein [Fontisphaera persica]|uniref:mannosyltransferase family protein n=1 Tax=Fontisphaera persica TaxID=2974023 RepID=UPI0024BF1BA8|nr:mannosyltransferase family protein [Fontisphaera persica]WCJ61129.1 mannosyltransferase family protein [Fontisphaera persica]